MDKPKVLSGHEIVARGVTKVDVTLPEIGLKDVAPNGSWLEQKQIQAALEARKHLVEVERIEKLGTLSHAIWWDNLKLAEVTQKTGGHWQYLGHNVGKTLYLQPEEALFLMEVNCLLLKHGGITVSLQKAYSLLLSEPSSFVKYRVYASLSRLGYKVYRHKMPKVTKQNCISCHKTDKSANIEEQLTIDTTEVVNIADQPLTDSSVEIIENKTNENTNTGNINQQQPTTELIDSGGESNSHKLETSDYIFNEDTKNESSTVGSKDIHEHKSASAIEIDEHNSETNDIHTTEDNAANHDIVIDSNTNTDNTSAEVNAKTINTDVIETTDKERESDEIKDSITNRSKSIDCNDPNETKSSQSTSQEVRRSDAEAINIVIEDPKENAGGTENNTNLSNASNADIKVNVQESVDINMDCQEEPDSTVQSTNKEDDSRNVHSTIELESADANIVMDLDVPRDNSSYNSTYETSNGNKTNNSITEVIMSKRNQIFNNYVAKLKTLTSRQHKPSNFKTLEKSFDNIPDLYKKEICPINIPDQQYIPKNIFVNKSSYVLNMKQIKRKSTRSGSVESVTYNSSDEVNGSHVRRIRSNSNAEYIQNLQYVNRMPPRQNVIFRPFNFWRPQNNYVQFNMFFQRPCFSNMYFHSRFQYQRPNPLLRYSYTNNNFNSNPHNHGAINNSRKRLRSARETHLQSIRNLAVRLKQLIMSGNNHIQNIESLHRLLYAYNTRYKARLRLTKNFEVVNDETIVETIDLAEDEESASKRRRLSNDDDMFEENLNLLRQLAFKLKELEAKGKSSPKHRRAMSKLVKTFNKSYDADIYVNSNFEIINRRLISIESDSESDCVIDEPKKVHKRKKLRNPFNILKRLTEKQAECNPSTSKESKSEESDTNNIGFIDENKYSTHISNTFNEKWLPREDDFGRAEVVQKNMNSRITDAMKEEYLNNYIKNHNEDFNNWLDAKVAFLQHMEETDNAYQTEHEQMLAVAESNHSGVKPLIDAEDCSDMSLVLEKLSIIKYNKDIATECNLSIHFDMYNRNVQNFRKTNPPKPHFRVICMEESFKFPSAAEVMALKSKYEDNINIVFAIVGISSVSYLQINPLDLPVYIANNDLD